MAEQHLRGACLFNGSMAGEQTRSLEGEITSNAHAVRDSLLLEITVVRGLAMDVICGIAN